MSPLFGRKPAPVPEWPPPDFVDGEPPPYVEPEPEPEPDLPAGDQPCTRAGCVLVTGTQCSYVDRRVRRCDTAWCPEHRVIIAAAVYCPRHAGIMTALLASSRRGHLPDIDNRAPSLANWVGNDLDERMQKMLKDLAVAASGETMIADPISYIYNTYDQTHRWERAWKLVSHTGVSLKIGVDVDESKDYVVRLRVGQHTVNRVVPPWVSHHEKREWVDPQTDAREREEFYASVCDQLAKAVDTERARAQDQPYYGST